MEVKQAVKLKRAKGIGGVLQKQLAPLETNERFLKKYSNLKLIILLNAKDSKYAAVVRFNEGKITVESVSNADEKALKKKVLLWDGMLKTTTPLFLKIAMGELSLIAMTKKIITRKIKAKGIRNLLKLQKIFAYL